ncbi:MAG: hypothetical protein ACETWE_02680 [Candidatus Bathyarchaeia archaeon]
MTLIESLNKTWALLTVLLFACGIVGSIGAEASFQYPNSLNSGYGITTDYHGEEVMPLTPVTAYAVTTKEVPHQVKYVVIRWIMPNGTEAWRTEPLELTNNGEWKEEKTYWASDTRNPHIIGDWGVQAIFYNKEKQAIDPDPPHNDKVAIRATSFFVVPEAPFGTIAVTLAMITAIAITALKRK